MPKQTLTGKAGIFQFNGFAIPFKTQKPETEREYADSTDSSNYDAATDLIHKSQEKVSTQTTVDVDGLLDLSVIPASLIASLYNGADAVPCYFFLKPGVPLAHGNFDLTKFSCEIPIDDECSYSASLKSNGKVTWLS
jgi:hypothetical protein